MNISYYFFQKVVQVQNPVQLHDQAQVNAEARTC